jgi:RNA polymerase sigma factor (sigma-70 family)
MTAPPDQRLDVDHVAALLVAARDGRDGGYDRLIATCRPVVERQARRSAWRAGDVDDIVQEVWIRLIENAGKIREPRSLLAWLTMVTSRAASQVGRRGFRLVPTELDDRQPGPASTEDQALRTYERRQVTDGVRAALGRLDAADQRVLLLLEGDRALSYREVSREVRRPIGSLGPTRQRLLRRLRVDPAVQRLRPAG